jgi:hypothetical protein
VDKEDLPEPRHMKTRGWIVKSTDQYVCLCASLDTEEAYYGDSIAIPRGMIETIRHL